MNPLAEAYVRRQIEIADRREFRRLAADIREEQSKLAPLISKNNALRKERMRQDGPSGFKMIFKECV